MRIEWTETAEADVVAIAEYIEIDNPIAALTIYQEIHHQIARLGEYPYMGRIGRRVGTRELVINRTPFISIYRVERGSIMILRVLHTSQRWPQAL